MRQHREASCSMSRCRARVGLFFTLLLPVAAVQSAEKRGFYLDAGIGYGGVSYRKGIETAIDSAKEDGLGRVTVSLDVSVGMAVRQNLYLVGSLTALGDRLEEDEAHLQVSTYLF